MPKIVHPLRFGGVWQKQLRKRDIDMVTQPQPRCRSPLMINDNLFDDLGWSFRVASERKGHTAYWQFSRRSDSRNCTARVQPVTDRT